MKSRHRLLVVCSVAAVVTGITAIIITVRSIINIPRHSESYGRRVSDLRTLHAMQLTAARYREILEENNQAQGVLVPLSDLLRTALPGCDVTLREREPLPTPAGWIARRFSVTLKNVSGNDLSRFLTEASRHKPAWILQECTLIASATPGHLTKAELVMGATELDPTRSPLP